MMKKFLLSLSLCLTISALYGWSKDGTPAWRLMENSPVSCHRKFANPAAGKVPTVLMLLNGIAQREAVELRQRFEYNCILLPIWDNRNFSPFAQFNTAKKNIRVYGAAMSAGEYKQELDKILSRLPECDFIIIGKLPWEKIPAMVQQKFLARVKSGASMILIGEDGKKQSAIAGKTFSPVKIDFPTDAVPNLKGTGLRAAAYGKGKIVLLDYPKPATKVVSWCFAEALTPFESNHPLYYDQVLAFIGKCLQHFSAPAPAKIDAVAPQGKIKISGAIGGTSLKYRVMDDFGKELFAGTMASGNELTLKLPQLPASARMLEAFLVNKQGKTLDFAIAPLKGGAPEIASLVLKKDTYKPDETICGKLTFADAAKRELLVTLTDDRKEVIGKWQFNTSTGEFDLKLNVLHQQSRHAQLAVKTLRNGKLTDEKRCDIYFNTNGKGVPEDFLFGMWSYAVSGSRVNELWLKAMQQEGIDFVMCASAQHVPPAMLPLVPRNVKRCGMDYAAYVTRLAAAVEFRLNRGCPFGYYEKYRQSGSTRDKNGIPFDRNTHFLEHIKSLKDIGAVFYNLGDENHLAFRLKEENCFCSGCQRRFRAYLKKTYGTLAKLNASYNSKYRSFEEIKAQPFEKSVRSGQYSLWLDFRLFMEEQFIDWHRYKVAQVREIDKVTRTGIEGMVYPTVFYQGFNFYKMLGLFDFCAPYFNSRDVHALKYTAPGTLKSAWFGTYEGAMSEQQLRQTVWRYFFAGLHGVFYWYSGEPQNTNAFTTACLTAPDFKPLPQFSAPAEEVRRIRNSGTGKLLMNSTAVNSGVWIHYSNNSMLASVLSPDKNTWELSLNEFIGIFDSLGIGFALASPDEIVKGIPANIKVLVLPYALAISDAEVKVIREFVKRGGMLIADHDPAIMDEHGKFRTVSPLQELFGSFDKMQVKKYGKGFAAYLDKYISAGNIRVQKGEAAGIQNGMLRLLAKVNVRPFANVIDGSKQICGTTLYQYGSDRYITLLAQRSEAGVKVKKAAGAEGGMSALGAVGGDFSRKVTLEKPMHVYDILQNRYLGKVKEFNLQLTPATGRVIACLEKVPLAPRMAMAEKKAVYRPGEAVNFNFSRIHNTAIFTVTDPDGKTVLEQRVSGTSGRFIPSFCDKPGTYQAVLRNVIGGKKATLTFKLQAR